jgi:ribonuclease-3
VVDTSAAPVAASSPAPPVGPRPPRAARPSLDENVAQLAKELGVEINEDRWFRQALYHTSYVNERGLSGISSNERLEFLGDAVLDLAVAQYLFERFPQMPEGELSRLRSAVVRASTLASRSKAMGLGRFALLGKGEERNGGRKRPNFLADLYEAVVGAIFLDQGIVAATDFVVRSLRPDLEAASEGYEHANYKAKLQDAVQRSSNAPISYHVLSMEGLEHARVWQCEVRVGGRRVGIGRGRTKRAAEQEAAREALLRGWSHAEV